MKLVKIIKKVPRKINGIEQVDDNGSVLMNSFTNFELEIEVNGNIVNVPIQPVNFGEKQNRWAYSVLSLSAIEKGSEPF
ncbi:MAG: hypothetical protein QXI16_01260 [Sulfolobaceae archaeon]